MAKRRRRRSSSSPTPRLSAPSPPAKWTRRYAYAGWALLASAALALALISTGAQRCRAETTQTPSDPDSQGAPNRLIKEASPYLRSAAYQPVDWYPFGPEAFERARQLDRPVLLDIGAVWCHWCHVMDRESYENPEIARLINSMFVAVKVDRDARPDIDVRYQRAVQAITRQGGWPLTAFLTPTGKVFFGGTYFPPESRGGRPGLKQLLPRVSEVYRNQKDQILAGADQIARQLEAFEQAAAQPGEVNAALRETLISALKEDLDPQNGGSKSAPKFPHGAVIRLALDRYFPTRDPELLPVAEKTLDAMAQGGLRDYLHGGFYRYSTDRFWHIPHFEKMAYVQAELLAAYAQGYRATGKPLYREAAREIIAYLSDTLSDQARGGFYATQDADVGLEDDGSYFTWSLAEVAELLTEEEARVFTLRYGVVAQPQRHPPETPDRNVLYRARSVEDVSAELGLPPSQVRALLAQAREKLRAARGRQRAPFVDPNKFIDWNALLLSAYRQAYEAWGDESVKEFALRTTDFLLAEAYEPGKGMSHTVFEGQARTRGLVRDQVYMALALLDMYEISARPRYLAVARDLLDFTLARFWDGERGAFRDVAHAESFVEILQQPRKDIQDAPLPGANAVAALALERLFVLTGEERYRTKAEETLKAFAGSAARLGTFAATYGRGLDYYLSPPLRVVILGDRKDTRAQKLWQTALTAYRPHKSVLFREPGDELTQPLLVALAAPEGSAAGGAKVQAWVCAGARCAATDDAGRLAEMIRTHGLDPPEGVAAKEQ
ncbi:MAG: thioredoxin domain-containing protein, partial [Terriglobia bacterium]